MYELEEFNLRYSATDLVSLFISTERLRLLFPLRNCLEQPNFAQLCNRRSKHTATLYTMNFSVMFDKLCMHSAQHNRTHFLTLKSHCKEKISAAVQSKHTFWQHPNVPSQTLQRMKTSTRRDGGDKQRILSYARFTETCIATLNLVGI